MDIFWTGLPWLLSALTGVTMWMAGNKDKRAWYLGIFAQFFWVAFDIYVGALGLLPVSFMLFAVYVRNLRKFEEPALVKLRNLEGTVDEVVGWLPHLAVDGRLHVYVRREV